LHHNINLIENSFIKCDEKIFYQFLNRILKGLEKVNIYPNPTGSPFLTIKATKMFQKTSRSNYNYITLRNSYISEAIKSKNIFNLENHSIFLNLGHLDYSIN